MLRKRRVVEVGGGVIFAVLLAGAFLPGAVEVEAARAVRGRVRVEVTGTGKARVKTRYLVSSPVAGRVERIGLQPGDPVSAGDALARVAPAAPPPLDARTRAEQRARLEAALGTEAEARSALERARVAAARAGSERLRNEKLAQGGSIAAQELEAARFDEQARIQERDMAAAGLRRAQGEVEAARAGLAETDGRGNGGAWMVRSPAAGRVLRVIQESEGTLPAGSPLLEIGDPDALEVSVDLLTSDAVRVRPGAEVELTQWGGDRPLSGRVRRVDPSAFTKVSALGIEEQRVNVIVDPQVAGGFGDLGDGYQVEASIVVDDRPGVLKVPVECLFRRGNDWALFAVSSGRAKLQPVQVGASNGSEAEVTGGIAEGQPVILHPSDRISDGSRVRPE